MTFWEGTFCVLVIFGFWGLSNALDFIGKRAEAIERLLGEILSELQQRS